jgi:hydroxymethylglutaryl-CoA lyase
MTLWALVFNQKGLQRARNCGLTHVALSASLSAVHSRHNLGCSVEQGLARCLETAAQALQQGFTMRMGLQCAFGGPMLKPLNPSELLQLFLPFYGLGVRRLALADTAARARPKELNEILTCLRGGLPGAELGLHLHGEPGRLAPNLEAAWHGGVDWLDVSLQGLGGCPFLPGRPPANLSTKQAVEFLAGKGLDIGVDLQRLNRAASLLGSIFAHRSVGT